MSGCKHSIRNILGMGVALFLILPRLALGDFGACPPYYKTFGPDDSLEEILTFINEINSRPGGGTLLLEPGEYAAEDLESDITGPVCIRATADDDSADLNAIRLRVQPGALLTLRGLTGIVVSVAENGVLFAENSGLWEVENAGSAFLRMTDLEGHWAWHFSGENSGVLVMVGGAILGADHGLGNSGYALLDGVEVTGAGWWDKYEGFIGGTGIVNSGTLALIRSSVAGNGGCDWYFDSGCQGQGIVNDGGHVEIAQSYIENNNGLAISNSGTAEVAGSVVDLCEGPVTDLGYNQFYAGGGCIVTDPTSTYYNGALEVVVRTLPYWKETGKIDLSKESALFVTVMSGGEADPTTIDFDTFEVESFPRSALRGAAYYDKNSDGMADYTVWYRLDRDLRLECGYYNNAFSAMTTDGLSLTGRLQFEAVGCTP